MTGIIDGPTGRYLSRPDERCRVTDLVLAAQADACVIVDIRTRTALKTQRRLSACWANRDPQLMP